MAPILDIFLMIFFIFFLKYQFENNYIKLKNTFNLVKLLVTKCIKESGIIFKPVKMKWGYILQYVETRISFF